MSSSRLSSFPPNKCGQGSRDRKGEGGGRCPQEAMGVNPAVPLQGRPQVPPPHLLSTLAAPQVLYLLCTGTDLSAPSLLEQVLPRLGCVHLPLSPPWAVEMRTQFRVRQTSPPLFSVVSLLFLPRLCFTNPGRPGPASSSEAWRVADWPQVTHLVSGCAGTVSFPAASPSLPCDA